MAHDILLMFLIMFGGFAIPLSLALLRYWSKLRPRALTLRYDDQQALLYRLTEGLNSAGFQRAAGSGSQAVFEPAGFYKVLSHMPVTVDLQTLGMARIVGTARYIAYIKRLFPAAQDQAYSGPSPAGKTVKIFVSVYGAFLVLLGGLLGASALYDRTTRDASGHSPRDVEQTLELTVAEARTGIDMRNISIEKTGRIQTISVPPDTKDGTRLRFPRRGLAGGFVSAGDLYLVVRVK